MVEQFFRLRLSLLANSLKRRPSSLLGLLIVLIAAAFGVVALLGIFGVLRASTPDVARAAVIVCGSALVLGFLVLPLAFSADDPLDPRRFALLGLPVGVIARGVAIATIVGIPALIAVVASLGQVLTWSRGPGSTVVALIAAVIIVPTCVLACRVSSAVAATLLDSRRARESAGVLVVALIAASGIFAGYLAAVDWQSRGLPIMRRIAAAFEWSPFGAAWAAPGDAALGFGAVAFAKLLIAAGFLVVLWLVWRVMVSVMLSHMSRKRDHDARAGLGWFDAMPSTPSGVIAARSLSYWGRDSRYRVSLAVIPILPLVMVTALVIGGVPEEIVLWIPVPVMCLFLGWAMHNDVAYDSSAFWIHLSSNTRGRQDRWGRLIPALLLGTPLVLLGSYLTTVFATSPQSLPGLIGLSSCLLLAGLGISSITSAAAPYPAVHPRDNPFAQPQAMGTTGAVVQSLSFLATIACAAPVVWLIVKWMTDPGAGWQYAALAVGVLLGLALLAGGVLIGGAVMNRRGPELLAFTLRN